MLKHYDIVIAGAGIAGATLANKLGHSSFIKSGAKSILLLDKHSPNFTYLDKRPNHVWDLRTVALSQGNVEFLRESPKVWDTIKSYKKMGFASKMHIYDASSPNSNGITFENPDTIILENSVINKAVLENIPEKVDFETGFVIESVTCPEYDSETLQTPLVEIKNEATGDKISTNLLIGADGAQSQIRQLCGFKQIFDYDYNTRAICAQLKLPENVSHENTAWQRFLPYGPIALLPLTKGYFNLVWSCEKEMALRLLELDDEKFIEEVNFSLQADLKYLNELSSYHLPSSTGAASPLRPPNIESLIGKRASFPLVASANTVTKPRLALIGDAGHRVHPLAGQGLNMGLRDVRNLHESILNGWYIGADIGVDATVLNSYNINQAIDNIPIGVGGHTIAKLFSTDFSPVVAARNFGMSLLDNAGPIKSVVAEFAKK